MQIFPDNFLFIKICRRNYRPSQIDRAVVTALWSLSLKMTRTLHQIIQSPELKHLARVCSNIKLDSQYFQLPIMIKRYLIIRENAIIS